MTEQRKVPIRTCVTCRVSSEKKDILRIVRRNDGRVIIDPSGKIPGRGAYLCGSAKCFTIAFKANKLGRALRCDIPEDVKNDLEKLMVDRNQSYGNEEKI